MSESAVAQFSIFGDIQEGAELEAAYIAAKKARAAARKKVSLPRKGAFVRHDLADPFADPGEQVDIFGLESPSRDDGIDWGPYIPWSEDAVFDFTERYLRKAIHNLKDARVSLKQKLGIMDWIFEPFAPDGTVPLPFSFQACCVMCRVDPEDLQAEILYETRREAFRKHFN